MRREPFPLKEPFPLSGWLAIGLLAVAVGFLLFGPHSQASSTPSL